MWPRSNRATRSLGWVGRAFVVVPPLIGSLLVAAALAIIWLARLSIPREMYVSELGAPGEATAGWFKAALLLIVAGGSLIAWAGRRLRSTLPLLGLWSPAVSLWIGCGFFLVASQVTCTKGCPIPYGPSFTWQDFIHTSLAVLAFAAACIAMLQCAFSVGHRSLRVFSIAAGLSVALIAGLGGILSLARFATNVGSVCELVATTIALAWVGALGIWLAIDASSNSGRVVRAKDRRYGDSRSRREG